MKRLIPISVFFIIVVLFSSCRNKTVELLTKKWDCVQVDNLAAPYTKILSRQDSADIVQLRSVLQSISWTFKNNMRYECAVNNIVAVKGKYELLESDKIMVCKPESKNNINRYAIILITEDKLVLSTNINNRDLQLHFKPH